MTFTPCPKQPIPRIKPKGKREPAYIECPDLEERPARGNREHGLVHPVFKAKFWNPFEIAFVRGKQECHNPQMIYHRICGDFPENKRNTCGVNCGLWH